MKDAKGHGSNPRGSHQQGVDQIGRTRVGFHGTKSTFTDLTIPRQGLSDPGLVGRAVYFAPEREQATDFATSPHYGGTGTDPGVIEAEIALRNPAFIDDGRLPDGRTLSQVHPQGITRESGEAVRKALVRAGHDGAIFRLGGEETQYAVFDPKKSVKIVARYKT